VNNIVANCHIRVLDKTDSMVIETADAEIHIHFEEEYPQIENAGVIAHVLNEQLKGLGVTVIVLKSGCLSFQATEPFEIKSCTYNLQMLLSLYYINDFPIISDGSKLDIKAVGFYVSTPILYLVSTFGDINVHNYITDSKGVDSNSVCMRIQNSFTPMMPLISSNADFIKNINVGDLLNLNLRLVDANLHDVHLLSPMWITFNLQQVVVDKEKDHQDFWQYNYMKPPRHPINAKEMITLNPEILEALALEPIVGSI
jgi:hypothetical protein